MIIFLFYSIKRLYDDDNFDDYVFVYVSNELSCKLDCTIAETLHTFITYLMICLSL